MKRLISILTVLTLLTGSCWPVIAEDAEPAEVTEETDVSEDGSGYSESEETEIEETAEQSEDSGEDKSEITPADSEETDTSPEEENNSDNSEDTQEEQEEHAAEQEPQTEAVTPELEPGTTAEEAEKDTESETEVEEIAAPVNVFYTTHLSSKGWGDTYSNGEASLSGRMEAIRIYTDRAEEEIRLRYQVHVQNIGWMETVAMNDIAGTTGRSLQIEAIRINLSGSESKDYRVFYRTYVDGFGWTDWAVNGKTSGSEGYCKALKQIEIRVLRADDGSLKPGLFPRINDIGLKYSAHVQSIGWQGFVMSPGAAGTTGRSLRMEAINIKLSGELEKKGNIQGRGHIQSIGWTNILSGYEGSGLTIGTVGQSLRLEAIELALTDDLAAEYDIYYRTHVQSIGWMGWASNGEAAGTTGQSRAIEAIEIRLVPKDTIPGFLNSLPAFRGTVKQGFCTERINGKYVKVYYDTNHNIVKKSFKLNQVYYQVDEKTGAIIHEQKLFTDKIFMEGIDISEHNGDVDLSKYQDGFVIIRIGWWTTPDKKAIRNMDLCEKYNIPYGVYLYDYTTRPQEAVKEAEFTLSMIEGRNIQCGIWFDMEDADGWKERNDLPADDERISKICQAYCETIQKAGYHVGIYASYYWFEHFIHDVDQYDKWVAHWGANDGNWNKDLSGYASMHQYTSAGGIDKDVMYVDPLLFR